MNNENGYKKALNIIMEANKKRPIVGCCQPARNGIAGPTGPTGPQGLAGEVGPTGPQGLAGETPTLTIGTVTTGKPGTQAAASITGVAPNYVLNLTIPQGPTGPTP